MNPHRLAGACRRALCLSLLCGVALLGAARAEPKVGVFYYPGWKQDVPGLPHAKPWQPIKAHPDREPLLGWYDEGRRDVMEQHLRWMAAHALKLVVFDYYWAERPILAHALDAYLASDGKRQVGYALMWANHDDRPHSRADYQGMVDDLVRRHMGRPEYLRLGGKPVLFVMAPDNLEAKAKAFGSSSLELTTLLRQAAAKAGLPGLLLVGGSGGGVHETTSTAKARGFDAFFAYNYHAGLAGRTRGESRGSRSYRELDEGYREHWAWFMRESALPYVLPITSGWDMRPWGGSPDPLHDRSLSTPDEFAQHLRAAREVLQAHPDKTFGLGLICCWNEFGEGSFIEPTKGHGLRYLEAVKSVFGP